MAPIDAGPLGQNEAGYRLLFDRNPWPMWVYDIETLQFLAVNQATVAGYGYSEAEFLGLRVPDLHPPQEQAELEAHLRLPTPQRDVPRCWRHRRRSGELMDVEISATSITFAGRPARLVMAKDVTQQRRADQRDAQRQRVLALIADGAPLRQVLTEIVHGIEASQPGMLCSVLLLDPAAGTLSSGAAPSLPDFYNAAVDGLAVGLHMGSCGTAAFLGRRVIVTDIAHDPHWAAFTGSAAQAGLAACWSEPIRSRAGTVLGTFGAYHRQVHAPSADELSAVTEVARMAAIAIERKLGDEALRESQKMESLGTLAGGIAHDFNNILGAILGNLALAQQDLDSGADCRPRLTQIQRSAQRARHLVQQILAFSRRQPRQALRQPLGPPVDETLALLQATLPAGVRLHAQLAATAPDVEADATQIQQVLMNLCTNAWHALPDAAGDITIGLDAQALDAASAQRLGLQPGLHAHLWVRDTGCGMDAATRARIFEPFFTTKPVGAGTGLGLAVVHGIVSEHHGAITVDSAPGQGATFHLYFPAAVALVGARPPAAADVDADADADAATAVANAGPCPAVAGGGPGPHILCVDDDAVMLLADEGLLTAQGFRVTSLASGAEAVAAVRADPAAFDLVVSDFNMPGASGIDLARDLAAIRPDLPVVICSGYIDAELRQRAGQLGVRALVHKENTTEDLVRVIRQVLAGPQA